MTDDSRTVVVADRLRRFRVAAIAASVLATACSGVSVETSVTTDDPASGSMASAPAMTADAEPTTGPSTSSTTADSSTTNPSITVDPQPGTEIAASVRTGAMAAASDGFPMLEGARVGLIVHQTSMVGDDHLIDLIDGDPDTELVAVFGPEHGVRGVADAGELVADGIDESSGVPIRSLYGSTRKPTPEMLADIDVLVFDLQDVGTRFYTYTATMGLAMQAAAEEGIRFVVFDRPNPLGGTRTEGPLRSGDLESFISQYPTPSTHGLTAGELALAIRDEGWLPGLETLDLEIVPLDGWTRAMTWDDTGLPWIPPSPGLPTVEAALVYPGTVLIEATTLSYGNGTRQPFTTVGAPWADGEAAADELTARGLPGVSVEAVVFVPTVIPDMAPDPRFEGEELAGIRITVTDPSAFEPVRFGLHVLDVFQWQATDAGRGSIVDRAAVFDLLAGSTSIRRGLADGADPDAILADEASGLASFTQVAAPHRLYD